MNLRFMRRGILVAMLAGLMVIPVQNIIAAEDKELVEISQQDKTTEIDSTGLINALAEIQKEERGTKTIRIETKEELKLTKILTGKAFVKTEQGYASVMEEARGSASLVGKTYDVSVVKVTERGPLWSKIQSGNVEGFVKTEDLITGKDAIAYAKRILSMAYPEQSIFTLTQEEVEGAFSVGETVEEEALRLAMEEAARVAAEQARIAAAREASRKKGEEIVSYAKRFIGNPYVYGGTSLTRGTDCSGFVQSVYKHFGVSLPRTSYSMRSVGYKVSYSEIQPGDIVCYSGHVGIYAGNGKIVNAIDEQRGIGMSNATYRSIITIRRIF